MADELMGAAEVAALLGVSRQRVNQLAQDDPTFPEPLATLEAGRVWDGDAIRRWARATGRIA